MKAVRIFHFFILLVGLVLSTACSSNRTIVHNLTEAEANNIIVFLDSKGLRSDKVKAETDGGGGQAQTLWNIVVDDAQATEAMALLNANGLPKKRGPSLLSIFSQGSALVPSELEEKIRYQAGLGEQIANTIRKIDGVIDSDVQLSFPEKDPLNPDAVQPEPTASVYVKHTGVLDDPNTQLIPKIKRLVASSVQSLKYDNVTVIPDRARFSDMPYQQALKSLSQDDEYITVWGVNISKDSVTTFRLFFFTFILFIFVLFLLLIWLIWKFYPVLLRGGGLRSILSLHPISGKENDDDTEEEKEEDKEEKKKKKEEESGPDLAGAEGFDEDEDDDEDEDSE